MNENDAIKERIVTTIKAHKSQVNDIFTDKNFVYSGSKDGFIKVWDKKKWGEKRSISVGRVWVNSIVVDSQHVFIGSSDAVVSVLDKKNWKNVAHLKHSRLSTINSLSIDKIYVFVALNDRTIRIWNLENREEEHKLKHKAIVQSMFSDNKNLYVALSNGMVNIWNKKSWSLDNTIQHSTFRTLGYIAIDKSFIFTATSKEIKVWDKIDLILEIFARRARTREPWRLPRKTRRSLQRPRARRQLRRRHRRAGAAAPWPLSGFGRVFQGRTHHRVPYILLIVKTVDRDDARSNLWVVCFIITATSGKEN